jgi:membrane protein YdbS with pleckstrin-like domain
MMSFEPGEQVIRIVHRHPFYAIVTGIAFILIGLFPVIAYFIVVAVGSFVISSAIFYLLLLGYGFWVMFTWIAFFVFWTDYFFDTWIITNKRIIDMEQKGLFVRDVATVRLEHIQDVRNVTTGIIQTFLDISTIHIQTAGARVEFIIRDAAHPDQIRHIILNAQAQALN